MVMGSVNVGKSSAVNKITRELRSSIVAKSASSGASAAAIGGGGNGEE